MKMFEGTLHAAAASETKQKKNEEYISQKMQVKIMSNRYRKTCTQKTLYFCMF